MQISSFTCNFYSLKETSHWRFKSLWILEKHEPVSPPSCGWLFAVRESFANNLHSQRCRSSEFTWIKSSWDSSWNWKSIKFFNHSFTRSLVHEAEMKLGGSRAPFSVFLDSSGWGGFGKLKSVEKKVLSMCMYRLDELLREINHGRELLSIYSQRVH